MIKFIVSESVFVHTFQTFDFRVQHVILEVMALALLRRSVNFLGDAFPGHRVHERIEQYDFLVSVPQTVANVDRVAQHSIRVAVLVNIVSRAGRKTLKANIDVQFNTNNGRAPNERVLVPEIGKAKPATQTRFFFRRHTITKLQV